MIGAFRLIEFILFLPIGLIVTLGSVDSYLIRIGIFKIIIFIMSYLALIITLELIFSVTSFFELILKNPSPSIKKKGEIF